MLMSNLIILTRYAKLGASSRVRFYNFFSVLQKLNIDFSLNSLIKNDMLQNCTIREIIPNIKYYGHI